MSVLTLKIYGKSICGESAVALGFFDGVHLGHKEIFKTLKENANGKQTIAITFNPHPIESVNKKLAPKLINTLDQRVKRILGCGVDTVIVARFNEAMANLSAEEFVSEFLIKQLNAKDVCVGFNFKFGALRKGDVNLLKALEEKYGYKSHIVPAVNVDGGPVSSTRIRSAITEGRVSYVKNLLGDYFKLYGKVETGRQVGRVLGFPTANLAVKDKQIIPSNGVYIVYSEINGVKYYAGCNIGIKPTFGLNKITIEAHYINFDGNLYDRELELVFVDKIRDEIEFSNIDELMKRINMDMEIVRDFQNKSL